MPQWLPRVESPWILSWRCRLSRLVGVGETVMRLTQAPAIGQPLRQVYPCLPVSISTRTSPRPCDWHFPATEALASNRCASETVLKTSPLTGGASRLAPSPPQGERRRESLFFPYAPLWVRGTCAGGKAPEISTKITAVSRSHRCLNHMRPRQGLRLKFLWLPARLAS